MGRVNENRKTKAKEMSNEDLIKTKDGRSCSLINPESSGHPHLATLAQKPLILNNDGILLSKSNTFPVIEERGSILTITTQQLSVIAASEKSSQPKQSNETQEIISPTETANEEENLKPLATDQWIKNTQEQLKRKEEVMRNQVQAADKELAPSPQPSYSCLLSLPLRNPHNRS